MNDELKPGDVVQLKSGGPLMTVQTVGVYTDGPGAECVWFEKSKRERAVFSLPTLTKG
jgi:uncharacterized protein YodC (DUF2158 family)